jgi:AcrR family transcriptional regulator
MARRANPERPAELLDAVAAYIVEHGVADLSLRPLARAVGSSGRGLLYHFGSKEGLIDKVFTLLRERQRIAYAEMGAISFVPLSNGCLEIWKAMSSSKSEPHFRLFFEAYSLALRHPQRFADFLRNSIEDWLDFVAAPMSREGYSKADARAFATLILAGFRGFMLDYCASHDRKRLDHALRLWVQGIDAITLQRRK